MDTNTDRTVLVFKKKKKRFEERFIKDLKSEIFQTSKAERTCCRSSSCRKIETFQWGGSIISGLASNPNMPSGIWIQ